MKSSTVAELEINLEASGGLTPVGHAYVERWNLETFYKAHFSELSQCDSVENNTSETFNYVIVEARSMPIILMMEFFRMYLTNRIQKMREIMEDWQGVCPNIIKKLEKDKLEYDIRRATYIDLDKFEVRHGLDGYIVNLKYRTCSCRL